MMVKMFLHSLDFFANDRRRMAEVGEKFFDLFAGKMMKIRQKFDDARSTGRLSRTDRGENLGFVLLKLIEVNRRGIRRARRKIVEGFRRRKTFERKRMIDRIDERRRHVSTFAARTGKFSHSGFVKQPRFRHDYIGEKCA